MSEQSLEERLVKLLASRLTKAQQIEVLTLLSEKRKEVPRDGRLDSVS